jgi:hypothetical protein
LAEATRGGSGVDGIASGGNSGGVE